MSEWITDRLPTRNDVNSIYDLVWVALDDGEVNTRHWYQVQKGQPWQPFQVPAPYVKPKRWKAQWNAVASAWNIVSCHDALIVATLRLDVDAQSTAQRICDIYNEVMP